ncbi:MAG: sugar O-acetyltransferase [Propionibacteriaceae bacterium]|jgi:galactoside O-acetyltransferase|nr:sugar O-acetyltransferase [Propionibacteriaceae bacterium]
MADNEARKERGLPYHYDDPAITRGQFQFQDKLYEYNQTRPTQLEDRRRLLRELFAEVGEDCHVETPLHANWGGRHVHLGKGVYLNSNVTLVDDADIFIGDYCLIAPNVVISTSSHPIWPILREHHYVYNLPVRLGRNVWVGSGVQIMPGVTIGDDSVIGAGSVVTADIPASVVAHGVPCLVIRPIGLQDRQYYAKGRPLDISD